MPLGHVAGNPAEAAELCRKSPQTQFVFMHIAYPYWQASLPSPSITATLTSTCAGRGHRPRGKRSFSRAIFWQPPQQTVHLRRRLQARRMCVGPRAACSPGIARGLGELVDEGWRVAATRWSWSSPCCTETPAPRIFRIQTETGTARKREDVIEKASDQRAEKEPRMFPFRHTRARAPRTVATFRCLAPPRLTANLRSSPSSFPSRSARRGGSI